MKTKLTISLVIGLGLALTWATLALADNGPHGGYTALTDACAGCHRAHTAAASRLLVQDVPQLCYTCHGNTGAGADTNVVDGVYLNRDSVNEVPAEGIVNRGLKGGGFISARMDTTWVAPSAPMSTTSNHIADGSTGTVWGNGAIGSGAGALNFRLSCVSCHDPHGGASTTHGPTYRILRSTLPITGATSSNVTDETNKTYTLSDTDKKSGNQYFGEGYNTPGTTWEQMDLQERELTPWCTQCHTRYRAGTGAGSTNSSDLIFAYRHMAGGTPAGNCTTCHDFTLPLPPWLITTRGPSWNHDVECVTCHVAHGTSASMSGFAGSVNWPNGATTPNGNNRSSLLRVDNRGVCELCHGK